MKKILGIKKTSLTGGDIEKYNLYEVCIIERDIDFGTWLDNHVLAPKEIVIGIANQFLKENIKSLN